MMIKDVDGRGAAAGSKLLAVTSIGALIAASLTLAATPASAQEASGDATGGQTAPAATVPSNGTADAIPASTAAPATALVQDDLSRQDLSADSGGAIVVTGSRLGEGFTAPTPVTTIGQAQIEQRAQSTVSELMIDIPQLRMNQNVGRSSEPVGQAVADLRGLGAARTLILLDGRRLAPTSPFGGIDTNVFPISLVSGVEVVTGGASAAYGSDAVAGVVNFTLQKHLEGLHVDASYGESKYGDYKRPVVSAAFGHGFMDDRLHVTVSGDFYRNTGQTEQASRPWGDDKTVLFTNPDYTPDNGQPKAYFADGAVFSKMTAGGMIVAPEGSPLHAIQFGPNGTLEPFHYGDPVGSVFMIGGDGASVEDEGNLMPHITRYSGYGRLDFDVSSNVSLWADMLYSRVEVLSDLTPNYDKGTLTIHRDNAYLPNGVADIMDANGITSFKFGRMNFEDGFAENNSVSRVSRYAFGVKGSFGDWNWDAYAQRSDNHFRQESTSNRITDRWLAGTDAVISPATGQPVCRLALTDPDYADCVPINLFGPGTITPAALDYYLGTSWYSTEMTQDVVAANLSGKPFATWAGPVSIAVGAEYRHETIDSISDPLSVESRWRSINQQPFSGKLDVGEAYLEVGVPLATDMAFVEDLEFNGAVRYTDYSSSGSVVTYKVGLNYSPIKDVRFRGTISRDIRAANINELYSGQNQVINSVTDPRTNTADLVRQLTGGNEDLGPEKADTYAFGVVLQPSFVPGLNLSIDYYSIKINGAIASVDPQTIVNNCFERNIDAFCSRVTLDANDHISLITATLINTQTLKTSGLDFEASYRTPLDLFGEGGSLTSRLLVNYVDELETVTNDTTTRMVGYLGRDYSGVPAWRANFDLVYSNGPFQAGAYVRYIGGGKYRTEYNIDDYDLPFDQNDIEGRAYFDLSASYRLSDNVQVYGKVDNLFNVYPPVIPNAITQPTIAQSQYFDKIGRYMVAGIRLDF